MFIYVHIIYGDYVHIVSTDDAMATVLPVFLSLLPVRSQVVEQLVGECSSHLLRISMLGPGDPSLSHLLCILPPSRRSHLTSCHHYSTGSKSGKCSQRPDIKSSWRLTGQTFA